MEKDDITSEETITDDVDVASADGDEAVQSESDSGEVEGKDDLSLGELNKILGKDFKDKDTALKAVKDTFNYVGKAGKQAKELAQLKSKNPGGDDRIDSLEAQVRATEQELYYSKHPEYEPYREVIKAMGQNPSEVVSTDSFKAIFEKAKGFDEIQSKKSVLQSNPRLNISTDKVKKSRDLMNESAKAAQSGDAVNAFQHQQAARNEAVSSVIDAFELDK